MTTKQATQLEKVSKDDMKKRMSELSVDLNGSKDVVYERWLNKEQKEARIIENNL
jgi:hypothetical protein